MTVITNIHRMGRRGVSWTPILVVLNLIVFGVISLGHFTRWDLTETSMYTLNQDTMRILHELEDTVTVKVFVNSDLPPGYNDYWNKTSDLLEEFRLAAGDKFNLIYLDPSAHPDLETEAEGYGIEKRPLQSRSMDRKETLHGYLGIALLYEGRFEAIPHLLESVNLEYDLLMKIARVMRRVPVTVAFHEVPASSGGESPEMKAKVEQRVWKKNRHEIGKDFGDAAESLRRSGYDVVTVSLNGRVPDDVTTLILANTQALDDVALYFVDQFLMRGGRLIIFKSGIRVDPALRGCRPNKGRLDEWLAHYGIDIRKNLICDKSCLEYPFSVQTTGGQRFSKEIFYPPYIKIRCKSFNSEHPITSVLAADMFMAFSSGVSLTPPEGGRTTTLLRSSGQAWHMEEVFEVHTERIIDPGPEGYNQYDLACLSEGSFPSYYSLRSVSDEIMKAAKRGRAPSGMSGKAVPMKVRMDDDGSKQGGGVAPPEKAEFEKAENASKESVGDEVREKTAQAKPRKAARRKPSEGENETADEGGLRHPEGILLQSKETAILVVGWDSSGFISVPQYMPGMKRATWDMLAANFWSSLQFFGNAVDYLSFGGGFSNIRAREVLLRFIDPDFNEKPSTIFFLKVAGTVSGAFLVVLLGLFLAFMRRSSRRKEVVL